MINLLMRFYDVDSGTITVDGTDIRDMTRNSLRQQLTAWCFRIPGSSTARSGRISPMGKPDATEEEMIAGSKGCPCPQLYQASAGGL